MFRTLIILILLVTLLLGCSNHKIEYKGFSSEQEMKTTEQKLKGFLKDVDQSLQKKEIVLFGKMLDENISVELLLSVNGEITKQVLDKKQYLLETKNAWKTSTTISEKRIIRVINKISPKKLSIISKVYNSLKMSNGDIIHLSTLEHIIISIKEKNNFKISSIDLKVKPL